MRSRERRNLVRSRPLRLIPEYQERILLWLAIGLICNDCFPGPVRKSQSFNVQGEGLNVKLCFAPEVSLPLPQRPFRSDEIREV